MVQKIVWIALAGAIGTLARYGLGAIVQRWFNHGFPWGTFVVNVLGCFAFGLVWTMAADRQVLSPELRVIVLVGFMGAFTTFSSFIFESGQMVRATQWLMAGANILGQVVIGTAGLFLGFALGRMV